MKTFKTTLIILLFTIVVFAIVWYITDIRKERILEERDNKVEKEEVADDSSDSLTIYRNSDYSFSLSYDNTKSFEPINPLDEALPFYIESVGVKEAYICTKDRQDYYGDPEQLKEMGFLDVSSCEFKPYGLAEEVPTVDSFTDSRVNDGKWYPFGANPTVKSITLSGQPAKVVLADPVHIEYNESAMIVVKLPQLIREGHHVIYLLEIDTTKPFVEDILSSFRFE